jgi:hypothetical protein
MENVGVVYGHLECFTAIWYILWRFGKVSSHLVDFVPGLACFSKKKSGIPGTEVFR